MGQPGVGKGGFVRRTAIMVDGPAQGVKHGHVAIVRSSGPIVEARCASDSIGAK